MFKKTLFILLLLFPSLALSEGEGEGEGGPAGNTNLGQGAGDAPIIFPPGEGQSGGRKETLEFMATVVAGEIKQTLELDEDNNKSGNYLQLEEKAKKSAEYAQGALKATPSPGPTHIYELGAPSGHPDDNNLYDKEITLHDETFSDCFDYKVIDVWVKYFPPSDFLFMPYVKYYGPPQKVENVDNPLKTGYISKDEIAQVRAKLEGDDYYKFAALLADYEQAYVAYSQAYQAYRLGNQFSSSSGYQPPEGSNLYPSIMEAGGVRRHYEANSPERVIKDAKGYQWPGSTSDRTEFTEKAVRDVQQIPIGLRYKNRDAAGQTSGYVYNEYHMFPTGIDVKAGEARGKAYGEGEVIGATVSSGINIALCLKNGAPIVAGFDPAFPHHYKNPKPFLSDHPDNIIPARFAPASIFLFPEMFFRLLTPEICQYFNINSNYAGKSLAGMRIPPEGRKLNMDLDSPQDDPNIVGNDAFWGAPSDLLTGFIDPNNFTINYPDVCQGFNQASWLPVLNTVQTAFHTTAAAVGTVRGVKTGYVLNKGSNYDFKYDNDDYPLPGFGGLIGQMEMKQDGDKVQWIRSKFMDGPPNTGGDEEPKVCRSVERWVLKYGAANMKHKNDDADPSSEDDIEDHWHVVNQWHYWRGVLDPCPGYGIDIYPPPGHESRGIEGKADNECISKYGRCQ